MGNKDARERDEEGMGNKDTRGKGTMREQGTGMRGPKG